MRPAFPLLVSRVRVTLQCRNDLTVLHFAVHQNHTAIGLLLLQHSADALAKDVKYSLRHRLLQNLSTPLSTARSHRNRFVPIELAHSGCSVERLLWTSLQKKGTAHWPN